MSSLHKIMSHHKTDIPLLINKRPIQKESHRWNRIKWLTGKVCNVMLIIICILYISPLLITITNSFMRQEEIMRNYSTSGDIFHEEPQFVNIRLIPEIVSLQQYSTILIKTPTYLTAFWNSIAITLPVVAGQLIVSSMCAYSFCVLHFKGKEILFFTYIIVMLLPLQVTLMPNYIVADALNMTNSYCAIILPGIFHPFGVFVIRQYMESIPKSYLESAKMDGAGHLAIFTKIVLPNAKPGLAAAALLTFIDYWNIIDQAVIFIQDSYRQPLSLFIAGINKQQMGVSFAASTFYVLPVLIILFYCQDYLKEGIQLSGIKV